MPVYSHSRLGSFEQCPRKYWYRYVAKVETEDVQTVEAFLGSRVHDALEELYARLLNGRLTTREELLALYDAMWKEQWSSDIRIVSKQYRKADYYKVGENALAAYFDRYQPFNQSQTLALETPIQLDLDGSGGYRMTGYIDRLAQRADGAYEIHDYKTARSLPTQAEADEDRQLALYQLGVQAKWDGVQEVDLIWHYVRFDKSIISRRTPGQLAAVKSECIGIIDDIESRGQVESKFPTSRSRLCDWCEYAGVCPAMKHLIAVQQLPAKEMTADAGVKLVDKLARLEGKRAALKEQIAAVEEEQDQLLDDVIELAKRLKIESVAGRTFHVDIVTKVELNYPRSDDERRDRFEQALRKAGLWDQLVTFNTQRFKSIWGEMPARTRKVLSDFVAERKSIEAKLKKGGAKDA